MNSLKKYFANNRYYKGKPRNDREARSMTTRNGMKYLGVFKNGWVLHYTNNPIAVITQGFMGLVGDKDDIWRTYGRHSLREIGKGYCFAFDANDENNFSYDYGTYALMFRASGIKAYNCVDEEPQVIFKAENANLKECFILTFSADAELGYDGEGEPETSYRNMAINVINPYTKKTVFSTPDMKRAIEWVKTNYRQYKDLNSFNSARKYKSVDDTLEQTTKEVLNYVKNELGLNVIGVFNDNFKTTKQYLIVLPVDEYVPKGRIRKALGFKSKDYTYGVRDNIRLSFQDETPKHFLRHIIGDDVQENTFNLIKLSYDSTETLEHKIKSAVKSVLNEYVNRILNEDTNENVVTLYHGGNKNEDPEMYPVYWLTNSKTMAMDYAFNNDWPCVYRVTIDTDKLSYENHVEHYDKYFNNAYCLGLRYLTPIINIEPLTEEETNEIEYDLNITEAVKSVLKENYHGEIYHFTTLPMLYCIVRDNSLMSDRPDQEKFVSFPRKGTRDEYGDINPYLCLTRYKNYNIRDGACVYCKLTFDADRLMNLRRARLYPVNWSGQKKINSPSEFEERLYNTDVYPFDKYIERIDIYVKDIAGDMEDGGNELEDELYDIYAQKYPDKDDDEIIAMYRQQMISDIMNDNRLKGRVFVHK